MANLKFGLRQRCQQLLELPKMMWKDKTLRIFLFGDYEYLCRVHGITGATGNFFFLYTILI
ncbi:hypothetical protein HOLleu_10830 [Holothuria leucospilota]|uniref:Uncharacterized protein n=1 Tax=Holothuria leucospilota TaxID=206669 RepID=A0A9Q1CEU4_HOLLE|nr:hypothetical protein HOLleu_10830 [Holothuria leucospilota]